MKIKTHKKITIQLTVCTKRTQNHLAKNNRGFVPQNENLPDYLILGITI